MINDLRLMRLLIVSTITVFLFLLLSFATDTSAYYFRGQIIPDPIQVPMWSNTPVAPMQQQQPLQSEQPNQSPSYTIPTSTPTITPTTPTIQPSQPLQSQSQIPTTQLPQAPLPYNPQTPTTQQPSSLSQLPGTP